MPQDTAVPKSGERHDPIEGPGGERLPAGEAALEYFSQYARERPEVVALWAFGIGFVLGWKLKPW